jgi:hypothetical protein
MAIGNAAGEEPKQAGRAPTILSAIVVAVLMGTLVAILAIVANAYGEASDAASILGILIPAVVSLGAAAFGVAVAYNAVGGKAEAEVDKASAEVKQQSAEEEKQQAAASAQQTATQALAHLDTLAEAVKRIVVPVQEAASNQAGGRDYVLGAGGSAEQVKVSPDDISKVETSITAAQSKLEDLSRGL